MSSDINNACSTVFNIILENKYTFSRNVYNDNMTNEIHSFPDASTNAHGCVIYVFNRRMNALNLLTSKAKVVPLKSKLTIPKLELLALFLSAKLTHSIVIS